MSECVHCGKNAQTMQVFWFALFYFDYTTQIYLVITLVKSYDLAANLAALPQNNCSTPRRLCQNVFTMGKLLKQCLRVHKHLKTICRRKDERHFPAFPAYLCYQNILLASLIFIPCLCFLLADYLITRSWHSVFLQKFLNFL